jgi:glyceraldehyde-3-phosphate dehydrogenase/erythrose-4-phosphate dehydrogenase
VSPRRTGSAGAARAVGLGLPDLAGTLDGIAVRVPVEDGSLTDLTLVLRRPVTADEVSTAFREAADGRCAVSCGSATHPSSPATSSGTPPPAYWTRR